MRHDPNNGCRNMWVQVAWQACNEARARLDVARDVRAGFRDCAVLNDQARIRPFDHELARISAYFRSQDWRIVCQMASLRCDPEAAISYAIGERHTERTAA